MSEYDFVPWSIVDFLLNIAIILLLVFVIWLFVYLVFSWIKEILFNKDDKK